MAFQGENSGRVSKPMRYRFSNSNGLAVAILTVAALAYFSRSAAPSHAEELKIDTLSIAQAILRDTNAYRQSKGLPALEANDALDKDAAEFAHYLAETDKFSHTADGHDPGQRIRKHDYKPCAWAENLWEGWSRPERMSDVEAPNRAMASWKKSPGHEANLRNAKVRHLGVGAAGWNHDGKLYVKIVQVFASDCKQKGLSLKLF